MQLQQHRFNTLSQAIASLEAPPSTHAQHAGNPAKHEFTNFVGCVAPTKISVRWGRPRKIQRPCRALDRTNVYTNTYRTHTYRTNGLGCSKRVRLLLSWELQSPYARSCNGYSSIPDADRVKLTQRVDSRVGRQRV